MEQEIIQIAKIEIQKCKGTMAAQAIRIGVTKQEPMLTILNELLRYCKFYELRYERKIGDDSYALTYVNEILDGMEGLSAMIGGIAMRDNLVESKDNSVISMIIDKIRTDHKLDSE